MSRQPQPQLQNVFEVLWVQAEQNRNDRSLVRVQSPVSLLATAIHIRWRAET